MHDRAGHAVRVGLIGAVDAAVSPGALAGVLARIVASLPPGPATLRLLHAPEATPVAGPGWIVCPVPEALGDAGTTIVQNSDMLLAAGDPHGALSEPVAAALRLGLPVLCLSPAPMRLLTDRFWDVTQAPALEGEAALAALRDRLASGLTPPPRPSPTVLNEIDAGLRLRKRALWRAHHVALDLLARPRPARPGEAGPGVDAPSLAAWSPLFSAADSLATAYADRYRSSYTIVLALAALALVVAVLGLRTDHHWPVAVIEALCLAGILALVWANTRLDWRTRLIQCRLLAELCRKQAALSFVGRSLPSAGVAGLTREGGLDWIGWRFAAAVRAAPLPCASSLTAGRDAAAAILLHGQRAYHEARVALGRRQEAALVLSGKMVFGATVLFVLVKLGLLAVGQEPWAALVGVAAALTPAIAAALFGFRAYAELELMVQHSERLIAVIIDAESSLARIDPAAPGAARAIGDVLEETATAMLADVGGWIQISRVKAVEAA